MRFDVVTLFPEMITSSVRFGVTGRALERGLVKLTVCNPRDFTVDAHKTVDDRPYGGGPGMVLKYQPLHDTVNALMPEDRKTVKVVYLSPQGKPITQDLLKSACSLKQVILVAGRYEGVDERFVDRDCDEEWSLGDYVISGGELGALIVIDAITRLLPGVLGDDESAKQDSYSDGLLDYPHFTRPERVGDRGVPQVLLQGNHLEIQRWRMKQALGRTWQRRPDLLSKKQLTDEQQNLLNEFINQANIDKN